MANDNLRVAHVLRKFDPSEWGGTETHVAAVCNRLGQYGWKAEIHAPVGPADSATALSDEIAVRRFRYMVPFIASTEKRRALLGNAGNIVSLHEVARLARDSSLDIAHVHTLRRIGGAVRTAMQWTGRPYVVSIHGPLFAGTEFLTKDVEARYQHTVDLGAPIGYLLGARRVIDDAARVISFNADEHRQLSARIGERAVRMDHGVEIERFEAGNAPRGRARWPQLGGSPLVVLLGRLAAQKNHLLALRAFAGSAPADHLLVFAGAQTDLGHRERLERAARELGILHRVVFLGNVDPNEGVPDLLAMTSVVLVPSLHEAFGLTVLEAWAAKKPVIYSRSAGVSDVATDRSVCLDVKATEDWIAALSALLANPEKRHTLSAQGRAIVERRFDWRIVTGKLDRLYRDVMDQFHASQHRRTGWGKACA